GTDAELTPQSVLELVGLVSRQPLSLSQFSEEFLAACGPLGEAVEFGKLLTCEEVVCPERLDQGSQGIHRTAPQQWGREVRAPRSILPDQRADDDIWGWLNRYEQ